MPTMNFLKQLIPAKRAYKRITAMLKSKLNKLKLPKAIKSTTNRLATFRPLTSISFKRRTVTKPCSFLSSRVNHRDNHHSFRHYNHIQKGYATIYIDQLCAESTSNVVHGKHDGMSAQAGGSGAGKQVIEEKEKSDIGSPDSIEDAWKAIVARSPQLRCVDERAEEFITSFKEEMRLQKERSLLEFQERLARSA